MKRKTPLSSLWGYLGFFAMVAVIVTVAVVSFAAIEKAYDYNYTAMVWFMLVVVLLLAAVCTVVDYLRRKYTVDKTVDKILEATDKIASGDFSVRLEPTHNANSYRQFDYIIENLNKMTAELSRTEVLHTDFISNVSHEIKTPLAIIQSYATSLQRTDLDEQTRVKYVQTLATATKKLTTLITNILKLNKLENQELNTEMEQINLTEMLAETVLSFEELIESKQIELDCDIEEDVVIRSSANYLETVWNNLLSNAIKFTDNGGKITVSLHQDENGVTVTVTDTGCGMSEETGKHIFEKFYQGDTSHQQEGNGLGLALVKRVIDTIGGTIAVESQLGQGTTFTIVLRNN